MTWNIKFKKAATRPNLLFLGALLLVILVSLLRLPLLDLPLERDEGEYAYIAWRMSLGEVPYRDWFDQKPPGVFAIYFLARFLPMPEISAIHFMAYLSVLANAI